MTLFKRLYPEVHLENDDVATYIKNLIKYRSQFTFDVVEKPVHGCIVEMTQSEHPHHVGTWLDLNGGGIAHCKKGAGVCFESLMALKGAGWRRFIFNVPTN